MNHEALDAVQAYELTFDGALLSRGFWLYIWEIDTPKGLKLYYVGRTGDSSSMNAQSPFNRMGAHLGFNKNSNVLRKRLESKTHNLELERCSFKLVALGPLLPEETTRDDHRKSVDIIAALEKALADLMRLAGYEVINSVSCRKRLDKPLFEEVRSYFAAHFPQLTSIIPPTPETLRIIGEESKHNGTDKLTSRQIDAVIKATRADRKQ